MAPELLNKKSYDEKVDIWSLGCILYEMCALTTPYTAANLESLKLKVFAGKRNALPATYSQNIVKTIDLML